MKPETEQTLATLEIILDKGLRFSPPYNYGEYWKPYIWDSEKKGEFSPLSLIKSEGWIQETDLEEAIKNWQWSEQNGLAAKGILNGDPYCIEDDEAEILLDENILLKSKLLVIYKLKSFDIFNLFEGCSDEEGEEVKTKYDLLHNFLHKNFSELLVYRFCFWDYEHLYILGEKGDRDRVGLALHSQFEYNP